MDAFVLEGGEVMTIFGLSIEDIASIVGIIGGVATVFSWAFNKIVVEPLKDAIHNLSSTVDRLSDTNERQNREIQQELHNHEIQLKAHEISIDNLKSKQEDLEDEK